MSLFSFLKTAGDKLFGGGDTNEAKADKVKKHLEKYGFDLNGVNVTVDGDTVTLTGQAKNFDEKQRMLATAGNVEGIAGVKDDLTLLEPVKVELPDLSKTFHEVKSGDTLSKISKTVYGDPNKYNVIFEANKPMLSDPNKIYPGQVLFIPPLA